MSIRRDVMTHEEKENTLKYVIFIKEKRHGTIKVQGCTIDANGNST